MNEQSDAGQWNDGPPSEGLPTAGQSRESQPRDGADLGTGSLAQAAGGAAAPEPASTGVRAADAALQRLRDVDTAALEEHVEIFDDVQRRLHDGLAELDDEQ